MSPKVFTMLENNPEVMNELAQQLGLSARLAFHDVYSLDDPDLLALVPRPVYALLTTIPRTEAWEKDRREEDEKRDWYSGAGPEEPVVWFHQTITHGCGLIGLLHCAFNNGHLPSEHIAPGSELVKLLEKAIPLKMEARARLLADSETLYGASESVAAKGDTAPILEDTGNHFVAFVKARDGHLWELEGARKGPLDRGALAEDEDALSEKALELGLKRVIKLQEAHGARADARFSCIALAPAWPA